MVIQAFALKGFKNITRDDEVDSRQTISGLYIASQAPYSDSEAVPDTTKSLANSLHLEENNYYNMFPDIITTNKIQHLCNDQV